MENSWCSEKICYYICAATTFFCAAEAVGKKLGGAGKRVQVPGENAGRTFFCTGTPVRYETSAARSPSPSSNTESSRNLHHSGDKMILIAIIFWYQISFFWYQNINFLISFFDILIFWYQKMISKNDISKNDIWYQNLAHIKNDIILILIAN